MDKLNKDSQSIEKICENFLVLRNKANRRAEELQDEINEMQKARRKELKNMYSIAESQKKADCKELGIKIKTINLILKGE